MKGGLGCRKAGYRAFGFFFGLAGNALADFAAGAADVVTHGKDCLEIVEPRAVLLPVGGSGQGFLDHCALGELLVREDGFEVEAYVLLRTNPLPIDGAIVAPRIESGAFPMPAGKVRAEHEHAVGRQDERGIPDRHAGHAAHGGA